MTLKNRLGIGVATVGALFSIVAGTFAQVSSKEPGCRLIDKNHPAQFILYEGRYESASELKLRLRNNSDCAIVVETDDVTPKQLIIRPDGTSRFESVTGSRDGVTLQLHYLVQSRQRQLPKQAYGWGDSVFTYRINPGQSVIFAVPIDSFKKRFDVSVPFNYAWEGDVSIGMGAGGVIHRVFLLFDDLPPDALREARRQ
ncbi:MAG TPA: hypothetical protein DC054_15850 [Blastocatellia bacterium]|nr:hypothetical protein [Blastocatellia bacterium]